MKILAIDSSGLVAGCAILEDEELVAEYNVNYKKTHSQTLLPMIDEIVSMTQTSLSDLDAVAVAEGPGSFTGLRIGSSTAKGIGLALGLPLIPVPTLEGLAYNFYGYEGLIVPMMDARRNQVYTAVFRFHDGIFRVEWEQKACPVTEVLKEVRARGGPAILLGDGVPVYMSQIREILPSSCLPAPANMNRQRAGSVGRRALDLYREGKTVTAAAHSPVYLRRSQAERELLARGGSRAEDLKTLEGRQE